MLRKSTTALAAIFAGSIAMAEDRDDTFQQSIYNPVSEATTDQVLDTTDTTEMARELMNPNTPLATLTFKVQHVKFKGNAVGANDSAMMYTFQPSFPFTLANGDGIFFRPAISFTKDMPGVGGGNITGWSDLSFDLAYGRTFENGLIGAAGIFATVPLGGKLGSDQFRLGPEFILAKISEKSVFAGLFTHQWDVGGKNKQKYSTTAVQLGAAYLPGNGWSIGTAPLISYDHVGDQWNVPINLTVSKTMMMGSTPIQVGLGIDKYVEGNDQFGRDTVVSLNFSPVVKNIFADMFRK